MQADIRMMRERWMIMVHFHFPVHFLLLRWTIPQQTVDYVRRLASRWVRGAVVDVLVVADPNGQTEQGGEGDYEQD